MQLVEQLHIVSFSRRRAHILLCCTGLEWLGWLFFVMLRALYPVWVEPRMAWLGGVWGLTALLCWPSAWRAHARVEAYMSVRPPRHDRQSVRLAGARVLRSKTLMISLAIAEFLNALAGAGGMSTSSLWYWGLEIFSMVRENCEQAQHAVSSCSVHTRVMTLSLAPSHRYSMQSLQRYRHTQWLPDLANCWQ